MINSKINFNSPEKEFILCRNISGATISSGGAVYFATATVTDGFAVSGARTGQKYLFAGIASADMASNSTSQGAKQMVQKYGICSAYVQFATSATSGTIGMQLDSVTSATYLTNYLPIAASSGTVANPWNFATLMVTAAADAANSTAVLKTVFVRA